MSRYSYAGDFVNPVGSWRVASRPAPTEEDPEGVEYFIEVFHSEEREIDGVPGTFQWWSSHTSGHTFKEPEDADDYIESIEESFERDYDDYLEENSFEIARMERYEMWRNEH